MEKTNFLHVAYHPAHRHVRSKPDAALGQQRHAHNIARHRQRDGAEEKQHLWQHAFERQAAVKRADHKEC